MDPVSARVGKTVYLAISQTQHGIGTKHMRTSLNLKTTVTFAKITPRVLSMIFFEARQCCSSEIITRIPFVATFDWKKHAERGGKVKSCEKSREGNHIRPLGLGLLKRWRMSWPSLCRTCCSSSGSPRSSGLSAQGRRRSRQGGRSPGSGGGPSAHAHKCQQESLMQCHICQQNSWTEQQQRVFKMFFKESLKKLSFRFWQKSKKSIHAKATKTYLSNPYHLTKNKRKRIFRN